MCKHVSTLNPEASTVSSVSSGSGYEMGRKQPFWNPGDLAVLERAGLQQRICAAETNLLSSLPPLGTSFRQCQNLHGAFNRSDS